VTIACINTIISNTKFRSDKEREDLRKLLLELRGKDYEEAIADAGQALNQIKNAVWGMGIFFIFVTLGVCVIGGTLGGVLGGTLFAVEMVVAEDQKPKDPQPDEGPIPPTA